MPRIPRSVLVAGLAVLVAGALLAIAMSGPDSPRRAGLGPIGTLSAAPLGGGDPPTDPPSPSGTSPSPSRRASPSASPGPSPSPSRSPSPSPSPTPVPPRSYEAEASGNVRGGGARVAQMDGASGGAGVYAIGGTNGGLLRFPAVAVPAAGTYTLTVYYQNPDSGRRVVWMNVNGGDPVRMDLNPTGGCCVRTHSVTVTLHAGNDNALEFGNPDARAPDLDRIVVSA